REPLVYSIGSWNGLRRFVVLRDVAGEDLEAGDLHAPHFHFFRSASNLDRITASRGRPSPTASSRFDSTDRGRRR
ncbi:hypothetical protein H7H37_16770, partial [Mycolicibacterium insubricum]|nr:hypothetical protein [Mycolicibacterium insubricum]